MNKKLHIRLNCNDTIEVFNQNCEVYNHILGVSYQSTKVSNQHPLPGYISFQIIHNAQSINTPTAA